ncbi:MAG: hypothetical protein ABI068_17190 [Ktedonobacterales bacterium]
MANLNPFVVATGAGLAAILWFCLISVARAYTMRRAYRSALATVQAGAQPHLIAY